MAFGGMSTYKPFSQDLHDVYDAPARQAVSDSIFCLNSGLTSCLLPESRLDKRLPIGRSP